MGQTGIGDLRSYQAKGSQSRKAAKMQKSCIGDRSITEFQASQVIKPSQMHQSIVGHRLPGQVKQNARHAFGLTSFGEMETARVWNDWRFSDV